MNEINKQRNKQRINMQNETHESNGRKALMQDCRCLRSMTPSIKRWLFSDEYVAPFAFTYIQIFIKLIALKLCSFV